jgi:hypothetical protein
MLEITAGRRGRQVSIPVRDETLLRWANFWKMLTHIEYICNSNTRVCSLFKRSVNINVKENPSLLS